MADFKDEPSFDMPIPGQSLTTKLGNFPWQQPPQFSTVEDASDWYIQRLTDEAFIEDIIDNMELGIPLTDIANALQINGVMQGIHTIHVGMLVIPVIMEVLAYMGDMYDVEYDMGTELAKDKRPSGSAVQLALRKVKKKMEKMDLEKARMEEEETEEPEEELEEMPEEGEPVMIGLMARRV
jgi:hypothetical protein